MAEIAVLFLGLECEAVVLKLCKDTGRYGIVKAARFGHCETVCLRARQP
jgi:hypothetical protein